MSNSKVSFFATEEISNVDLLNKKIAQLDNDALVLIAPIVLHERLAKGIEEALTRFDICHAGLAEEGIKGWAILQQFVFNWNFFIPSAASNSFSWLSGQQVIAFRKSLWDAERGFDETLSLRSTFSEFTFRCMRAGALVCYQAHWGKLLKEADLHLTLPPTNRDLVLFSQRHLGAFTAKSIGFYLGLPFLRIKPYNHEILKNHPVILKKSNDLKADCPPYSAIIPTIHRYDYIGRSIDSLLKSEYPPFEIIVVDQTKSEERREEVYRPYLEREQIKVFYLDSPGQCVSRNLAIQESKTDWLLFFEDDTEAWPGMMAAHWSLLSTTIADVSTGVSLAPWKDESYIPIRNRQWSIADVLATGNAFMRKETALSVNGLNLAFDRGSGADDDFGRRLFLAGKLIIFNHKAIQTHHKAPQGGMRVHGAWWRYSSSITAAFPPPTQQYMIQTYYPSEYHNLQNLMFYLGAFKKVGVLRGLLGLLLMPIKWQKSMKGYKSILARLG